jgi:hypothetical protein
MEAYAVLMPKLRVTEISGSANNWPLNKDSEAHQNGAII